MPRRVLVVLLAGGLMLLILACAFLAAGRLLAAMEDDAAAGVIDRCALVAAILAGVDIILLVFVLGYLMLRIWDEPEEGG